MDDSAQTAVLAKSWPITALAVGQALSGAWALVSGALSLRAFLLLGGYDRVVNGNGEWSGLGSFLGIMSAGMAIYLPLAGILRLATALGLHRRQRWARWIVIGLSTFDVAFALLTLAYAAFLVVFHLPGLALATFALVVLLQKRYADKFRSARPQGDAPPPSKPGPL